MDRPGTDAGEALIGGVRLRMASATSTGTKYRENYDHARLVIPAGSTARTGGTGGTGPHPRTDEARGTGGGPAVLVVDGMGDGPGSMTAGRLTVDGFTRAVSDGADTPGALRAALARIHEEVGAAGADLGVLTGCTLTALVAAPEEGGGARASIVQLGDCRAYRLRAGVLELLTVDHTAAWLGVIHGWYAAGSPRAAADRYRLIRYVGHGGRPEPDVLDVRLRPGDVYVLCTDGVGDALPYQGLADLLVPEVGPGRTADAIVRAARAAGGDDNIAVVVVRVDAAS